MEVVLDLRAVGDGEAERMEQRLDALLHERERMERTHCASTPRQRDVERVGGELQGKLGVREGGSLRGERILELLLRGVDGRASGLALVRRKIAQPVQQLLYRTGLPKVARLRILERGRVGARREFGAGLGDESGQVGHRRSFRCDPKKKGGGSRLPRFSADSIRPERLWPAPRSS